MRNFLYGFIFGLILGGVTIAYADVGVLFNSLGTEIGTDSNPLYVEII